MTAMRRSPGFPEGSFMAATQRRSKSPISGRQVFGLPMVPWVLKQKNLPSQLVAGRDGRAKALEKTDKIDHVHGRALFLGADGNMDAALKKLSISLPIWVKERALRKRGEAFLVQTETGPLWLLIAAKKPAQAHHAGLLVPSAYALARDVAATLPAHLLGLATLQVEAAGANNDERLGLVVGLEMGAYRYRHVRQPDSAPPLPLITISGVEQSLVEQGGHLGLATNLARHLVNVPAGELNPESFGVALNSLFSGSQTMSFEVLTGRRLEKERMGLLNAVGKGAAFGPALVKLSFRPKGKLRVAKPLAFVGKGVTFDTGGLDIKDAGSMRLMKKDMGGSASLSGLAYWVESQQIPVACDFYLVLAENAVDKDSFHPGDVLVSRAGHTVEIDNTDAEGRLVLADAIDFAVKSKGKEAPAALIDLATLTGAMRVGLGTRIGGLFANHDAFAEQLLQFGQRRGDPLWRMPLFPDYFSQLKSTVADFANSGPGRFGGAITAALFLQKFVGDIPWAHIDMYAWTEGGGGCQEGGGNGQCVQLLAEFLTEGTW